MSRARPDEISKEEAPGPINVFENAVLPGRKAPPRAGVQNRVVHQGGVFKNRLNKNMRRSIILAKGGRYWIYEFLFAEKDQANIDYEDLDDFRGFAKKYAIAQLFEDKDLTEICNGDEGKV